MHDRAMGVSKIDLVCPSDDQRLVVMGAANRGLNVRDLAVFPLAWVCRRIFGSYRLNYIYGQKAGLEKPRLSYIPDIRPIENVSFLERHSDPRIQRLATYKGEGAFGFAAYQDGHLASVCWIWTDKRFRDDRLWILSPYDAMLVEIYTTQACRRKGLASALIAHAAAAMGERGFGMIYASIWWSNRPSIHAFQKAGWRRIAFVAELYPLGARNPLFIRRCATSSGCQRRSFEISWGGWSEDLG